MNASLCSRHLLRTCATCRHPSFIGRYGLSMIGQLRMNNLRALLEDVLARSVPGSFVGAHCLACRGWPDWCD